MPVITITITSPRSGTGKSTAELLLASALCRDGAVALIDAGANTSLSTRPSAAPKPHFVRRAAMQSCYREDQLDEGGLKVGGVHLSLRALIARGLIERKGREERRGARRGLVALTTAGFELVGGAPIPAGFLPEDL